MSGSPIPFVDHIPTRFRAAEIGINPVAVVELPALIEQRWTSLAFSILLRRYLLAHHPAPDSAA